MGWDGGRPQKTPAAGPEGRATAAPGRHTSYLSSPSSSLSQQDRRRRKYKEQQEGEDSRGPQTTLSLLAFWAKTGHSKIRSMSVAQYLTNLFWVATVSHINIYIFFEKLLLFSSIELPEAFNHQFRHCTRWNYHGKNNAEVVTTGYR